MNKEFRRGLVMLVLVVALALGLAAVSGSAQSSANKVVANVPFEFSVGYKSLPAGEYSVQTIASAGDGLLIKSIDGKISALRSSEATLRNKNKSVARLIFHRYGDRYFLAEVWNGVDNSGRQLIKSQEERALENELAATRENAHAGNALYEIVEVTAVLR